MHRHEMLFNNIFLAKYYEDVASYTHLVINTEEEILFLLFL
jgi:hypothetical protein